MPLTVRPLLTGRVELELTHESSNHNPQRLPQKATRAGTPRLRQALEWAGVPSAAFHCPKEEPDRVPTILHSTNSSVQALAKADTRSLIKQLCPRAHRRKACP